MKKIPIYIFIIIILTGLFSPTFNVHASKTNPEEHCSTEIDPKTNQPKNAPCTEPYILLEPLPGLSNTPPFYPSDENSFFTYLNIVINLFIGLCAVLAVVMIVIGGIEYSTSELISSKESAKEKIRGAIFGLLLALGAYTILFQINPDLLKNNVDIKSVTLAVNVKEFKISAAQSRSGVVGSKVDLKKEGCPAATAAAQEFKMDRALLLAVFQQETIQGSSLGGCRAGSPGANMRDQDLKALARIVGQGNVSNTYVSCASPQGGTHGGAMGPMQFLPTTWEEFGQGNPWDLKAAMRAAAKKLSNDGGNPWNQNKAVERYFGACIQGTNRYCDSVENHKINFQKQIAEGVCNP